MSDLSAWPETARLRAPDDAVPQPWDRLAHHLAIQGRDLDLALPPRQFAGGFGNLNYLLRLDDDWAVLRRPPLGPLPPGANDMARENRMLVGLAPILPLVPRSLYFCDDGGVLGQPFLIMEYRPGIVIGGEIPARYADFEDLGGHIATTLVDVLAALHAVDPAAAGLGDLGRPDGFLERAVDGWAKRAKVATDDAPPPVVAEIVAWLRAHGVRPQPPTLLHNDFKLDNTILDPATLAPVAVVDWDMGSRGDPLFDLATLLSYWVEAGDPPAMHAIGQMPTAAPGFPGRDEVATAYARKTGRDLSDFLFYRVLTGFKLGVVFIQLHARYRRGETDDPRFAGFGRMGEGLLEFAYEIARGRGS
ncbi:MAG: phosphotransferase family protein [Alphaproteobacteria bacterium]|nr:phosphotransferase family protein [Alphaproteobacteria bacterium]